MAYYRLSTVLIATSVLLVTILLSQPATAQLGSPNPEINLNCPDAIVEIEVGPGDSRVGTVICTLENPSAYQEDINITVEDIGLNVAYPSSVSVAANSDQPFTISWSANNSQVTESFNTQIEARITSVNTVPYLIGSSKSDTVNVEIVPFGRPWIDLESQELLLEFGGTTTLNFSLRNTGNAQDTLRLSMENQSGLETFGFTFAYSDTSAKLGVNESKEITLTISAAETIADGSFLVVLLVDSELAEDAGESWVVDEKFRLISIAKEESFLILSVDNVPAWAITVAMILAGLAVVAVVVVAVIMTRSKRGKNSEFDFDDDFGDDFDLDDDDYDDFGLDDL